MLPLYDSAKLRKDAILDTGLETLPLLLLYMERSTTWNEGVPSECVGGGGGQLLRLQVSVIKSLHSLGFDHFVYSQ